MNPSPVQHLAQLLAAVNDPHAIIQILDSLFDAIAPLVIEALIVELTKLLEHYVEGDETQ